MDILLILLPFTLLGIGVIFIAFSGGPGAAREAYLTRGNTLFRVAIPILYVVLGIAVPALIIANREEAKGGTGRLEQEELTKREETGKKLFRETCASCHTLEAVQARGVTGPNLDEIGSVNRERVLQAIVRGGTGQKRMPAGLLQGEEAEDVALYVSKVAGK
jgi:cytochrome c553